MPTTKPPSSAARKSGKAGSGRKLAEANSTTLPILQAQIIKLEDGTEIPVKIPPGMSTEQAQGVVDFLKSNPQAAKAAWDQAQGMLKTPGFANAMVNMQNQQAPANPELFMALKDDEDLKHVFEDIQQNGPTALHKYWEDKDLMSKISQKMRSMKVTEEPTSGIPTKTGPTKPASDSLDTLHDAAKWGDVDALSRLSDHGQDVNEKNDRGITPLGVAVGFNRKEAVAWLLEHGADVAQRDSKGNSVLHYAAGYGRQEVADMLLAAGAQLDASNDAKQKPVDVARLNGEKHMVEHLLRRMLQPELTSTNDSS
eukprot:jgi/Chrzof1/3080/Cz12g11010.t1